MREIEELLALAADLERFAPQDDALGRLIESLSGDELDLDALDRIAAAASHPDYARFLESVRAKEKS